MKTIVVYKSKSGFAKKYAEMICDELSADLFEASSVTVEKLASYDIIIYGGGLYAVGINGLGLITRNLTALKDKKLVVYATGASPSREDALLEVRNRNFTPEQQKYIRFFYMRGGFDYNKLTSMDKVLMQLMKLNLKRKKAQTADERGMLAAYDHPLDFTAKKNITELIQYVRAWDCPKAGNAK